MAKKYKLLFYSPTPRKETISFRKETISFKKPAGFPLRVIDDEGQILDFTPYEMVTLTAEVLEE